MKRFFKPGEVMKRTRFKNSHFNWDWHDRDFFYSMDGIKEHPEHHCKKTYVVSKPFITLTRNSIDVGCRDGEYARYLMKDFDHVYCFDYRERKFFPHNVDTSKVSHYLCALGNEHKTIKASGRGKITKKVDKRYTVQQYTLDEFNIKDVDYIKIDVDGYEEKVLGGAHKTIEEYQPILVLEAENGDLRGIHYCQKFFGYEVQAWDDKHRNVVMTK